MNTKRSTLVISKLLLLGFILVTGSKVKAQIAVQTWHDGHASAFSLTYDDGTKSHYTDLRPILNKYNIKASFYLNTSLLSDNTIENAHSGSWEEFKTMVYEGHEMGSHGVNHPDLTTLEMGDTVTQNTLVYELYESKRVIEEKIGNGYQCITHAYPYCINNASVQEVITRYYESARACGSSLSNSSSPNYPAINSMGYDWIDTRESFFKDFRILNYFFETVENDVINKGAWGILLSHEVLPFADLSSAGTWEPASSEWMIEASKWLSDKRSDGKIWIGTVADVTRYAKERDAFYFNKLSESEDSIRYFVGDNLDNDVFNFPLTVAIEVPASWKMVQIEQDSTWQNYMVTGDENPVIKAHIIPSEDTIILYKLPDNQLIIENAIVTESANELLIRFNDKVIMSETTSTGLSLMLNNNELIDVTGFTYTNSDSLELKFNIAISIKAGEIVSISSRDSEIYSTALSKLNDITNFPVRNNSKLVEDEYKVLSVADKLIEQDHQSADIDIYVFSTSGFTLELESHWAGLSNSTGLEYDTLQVHIDENQSISDRSDTIYIHSDDGFEETIIISQQAFDPSTGQEEIQFDAANKLTVYPSPASDFLNISIPSSCELPASLSLVSINGEKIKSLAVDDYLISMELNNIAPGFYFLRLHAGNSLFVNRIIVK